MWLWALTAAHATGLQPSSTREPLPAREVEREIALAKGWRELELRQDATGGSARVRAGLTESLEVAAQGGWAERNEIGFGAAMNVLRLEPPNTSAAVRVEHALGSWETRAPATRGLVVGRQQFGGLMLTTGVGSELVSDELRLVATAELVLQAGPLVWAAWMDERSWGLRGTLAVSRGFELSARFDEGPGWGASVVGRY